MMNDGVTELFIRARKNKMIPVWIILIAVAVVAIDTVLFALLELIGVLLVIMITGIGCYGSILLIKRSRLEYELSIVSGEMTISEIRNQTWRKKVMSFDIRDAQGFKIAKAEEVEVKEKLAKENNHKVLPCFNEESEEIYFFTARGKDEGVQFDIFIDPDERIKKEMASRNPEAKRVFGL